MTLKDNAISTLMGIAGILFPALLIEHYTAYAAPTVVFFGVVLAAFMGVMFGAWNVQSEMPLDSEQYCNVPPLGWECSREPGHEGPCAAFQVKTFNL